MELCSTFTLFNVLPQIEKQQLANPKKEGEEPYKPLAPVLENSVVWGGFMGLSTNLRYQLVNGFEDRILVRCRKSQSLHQRLISLSLSQSCTSLDFLP